MLRRACGVAAAAMMLAGMASLGASAQSLVAPPAPPQTQSGQQNAPTVSTQAPVLEAKPFGAGLFLGPGFPVGQQGPNASYQLLVGDQVRLNLYGAIQQEVVETIDAQGNIFVPQVGPVQVAGVQAGGLTNHLRGQIQKTFPGDQVQVYASVVNARNIGVFVTGFVGAPGRYPGLPSDSIIDFIARAGGILIGSGSYRNVVVKRNDVVVANADLYNFLISGTLPRLAFREGDTIVVGAQNPVVKVQGQARNTSIFEFARATMTGRELSNLARPLPGVTHVYVNGTRDQAALSRYMTLAEFQGFPLNDQDTVLFSSNIYTPVITVNLMGTYQGPGTYVVDRSTTLFQLLDHVPIDPAVTDTQAISVRRKSVAEQQKAALTQALDALERAILTANVQTSGEAAIRSTEAQMVMQFVQRARGVVPDGTLVLAGPDGRIRDMRLEEGDTVVIPQRSSVITIAGEVLSPQSYLFDPSFSAADYVARAGGYTDRADTDKYLVRHLNGAVDISPAPVLRPGDQLIIPPEISFKGLQFVQDIGEVIFRTLATAAVAINIGNK